MALWNWTWTLLSLWLIASPAVLASSVEVQDDAPGVTYSGFWLADASPQAHGGHETWTNQSGAYVWYDFQGTQLEVYATMRPIGSYLTNVSFTIDDGVGPDGTTEWWTTDANNTANTFNKLVWTSPVISGDSLHRINITNYGAIFWFVYMNITTATVTTGSSSSSTSSIPEAWTWTWTQSAMPTYTSVPASAGYASGSSSHTPLIVGVVVGVAGGIALIIALFWCLRIRKKAREQEMAAVQPTPFASMSPATSTTYFSKDRAPSTPPHRARVRWLGGLPGPASDPGYPSSRVSAHPSEPRPHSEPVDARTQKQLATLRGEYVPPSQQQQQQRDPRPLPAPPHMRIAPESGPVSVPSGPETPTAGSGSLEPHAGWGALELSRARYGDPALSSFGSGSGIGSMGSAIASSHVLPAPSASVSASASERSTRASRPLYFRVFRRSRDGGVRLAGGGAEERGVEAWTPLEYDEVVGALSESSTLPPSYRQYSVGPSPTR